MQIDWAVFGEHNGGHALHEASGNSTFAVSITQYTDRPGDPPLGSDWGPVMSGFYFAEHYVLLRTLPDPTAGRAGMVRSFAAFLPVAHLALLQSLTSAFAQLPHSLAALRSPLSPLAVSEERLNDILTPNQSSLADIAERLGSPTPPLPIIWASAEPYLPTVDAIWGRLPASLRPAFAFSFQFAPEYNLPTKPTIVATLPSLAGRWPAEQILRGSESPVRSLNSAQRWLAGVSTDTSFNDVLGDYGIVPTEFSELSLLSLFTDLVHRLPNLTFEEARKAVRIVQKYSKPNMAPARSRAALFDRLCSLVSTASLEEIATLRNLDEKVLGDLIRPLQKAMEERLRDLLSPAVGVAIIELASDVPERWWSRPFLEWLDSLCRLLRPDDARALCTMLGSEKLARRITLKLAGDAATENALVRVVPKKIAEKHAESLLRFAVSRGWMRLHATCLLASHPEIEAIQAHAEVAALNSSGFELLFEQLGFEVFLRAACKSESPGLVEYAGKLLPANASSISPSFVDNCSRWTVIATKAVELSTGALFGTFRALIIGTLNHDSSFEGFSHLLEACTDRDVSIWFELANPVAALNCLSDFTRDQTVAKINARVATELAAVRRILLIKPDAFRSILSAETIFDALATVPTFEAVRAGVNAFQSLQFLNDDQCCRWLIDLFTRTRHNGLQEGHASEIAAMLIANNFPKSARIVRDTVEKYNRRDVSPILHEIRYKYEMAAQHQPKPVINKSRLPKVLIATALPLERSEVIKQLGRTEYDPVLFADVTAWPVEQPVFAVYVLATGAGNLEAQGSLLRALGHIKPKLAFFVGVAGGLKDSEVGDVVYGTKVHYYEGGKEEEHGISSRPASERSTEALIQLAHRIAERSWQPEHGEGAPKATPAVVASGEKVLTSTGPEASTLMRIKSTYNDSQVVDMEAYGFLKACADEGVEYRMVIRGVSDKVAGKAESDAKGNQPLAVRNAAAFLFTLLRACPELLNGKKRKKKFLGIS